MLPSLKIVVSLFNKTFAVSIHFQVMIQRHNRHMSISLYISVLAVADTIVLLLGR